MDKSLFWFFLFLLISIVAYLIIPRKQLYRLLPFGIVAGFILAMALLLFTVSWIELWQFSNASTASLLGIPLFLAFAWVPATMIFAHYVPVLHERRLLIFWIMLFTFGTTMVQSLLLTADFMRFLRWDLLASMLGTFSIHTILALFVLKYDISLPENRENKDRI